MEPIKVIKIGNSKGVVIPHLFCKRLGINIGDFMDCWLTVKDEIVIIRHGEKGKPTWVKEK